MNDVVLLFLTVPVITALIGWVTNWAAVKMIFYPERFIGLGPFGWQAILFKQSHKLATGIANMATENLVTARELSEKIDADEIQQRVQPIADAHTDDIASEIADVIMPGAWDNLPVAVKEQITGQINQRSKVIGREVLDAFQEQAEDLVDLHKLVVKNLSGERAGVLARLTKKIGKSEFKFIEYYGGVFGFIIGMMQIGVWSLAQVWWVMPIAGLIVGLVTNWLAIQMIFRPQEPTRILGLFKYQGLFPKRQAEIAADYGESAAQELLTPANFIELLTTGDSAARLRKLFSETLRERLDSELQRLGPAFPVQLTDAQKDKVATILEVRLIEIAAEARPQIEGYLAEAFDIESTVRDRLANMPKDKFERILRTVFEEDEITLILVGGFLGCGVGCIQAALVLAL